MPDTITVSMSSHQNRSGIIVLSGDWSGRMRPHPVLHSRAWPGRAREGQGGPGRARAGQGGPGRARAGQGGPAGLSTPA